MPPASNIWTPQREVTLVDELSKRRFLQVAWLPLSPGGSPRFVEAIDDDGQRKIGKDFLSMLFVAVFGREAATDPEVIRRKLNALCKVYFRELKDLDAEASPEKHLIPWGRLPIDRYQRRPNIWPLGPANVKMEAMDSQDASSLERFTVDAAVSQAAALYGGKTFRTWKIEAKALRLQNTQLQTQLELEQSKVENLRLRERVRILEASAQEPARREEDGEQDRRRGSSRRRGSQTRSRRTTSTGKGKGKEKARDRADSDTLSLSSDTEDSDDKYVPEESSSPQKRPKK